MCYADPLQNYSILVATKPPGTSPEASVVLKDIQRRCKEASFVRFEIPSKILLVDDVWTPEADLVTAALKLKRRNIVEKYKGVLDSMYAEGFKETA